VRQILHENGIAAAEFVIDCQPDVDTGRLVVMTGNNTGGVQATQLTATGELHPIMALEGGHTDAVRACRWNFNNGYVLTGGEDARICVWTSTTNTIWTPRMLSTAEAERKAPLTNTRFKPY
jgi:WD40 repeat protein